MRIRTTLGAAVGAALVGAAMLLPGAQAAPAPPSHHTLIPSRKGEILPATGATVTSLNWGGYAVTAQPSQPITAVASSFTVPAVSPAGVGFAATWAGIGGYNTQDLIQAGVAEQNPLLGDYAWYEILPASETQITGCAGDPNCTVNPGDQVSVDIHQLTAGHWQVDMADAGHWTYSTQLAYTSTNSSAEWILEAPSLAGVQTVLPFMNDTPFGPGNTFSVNGGGAQPIAAGNPDTIQLVGVGPVAEGQPSALTNGDTFTACAYSVGCPSAIPLGI